MWVGGGECKKSNEERLLGNKKPSLVAFFESFHSLQSHVLRLQSFKLSGIFFSLLMTHISNQADQRQCFKAIDKVSRVFACLFPENSSKIKVAMFCKTVEVHELSSHMAIIWIAKRIPFLPLPLAIYHFSLFSLTYNTAAIFHYIRQIQVS